MADIFDDPDFQAFLRRAKEQMFPKMKNSAISVMILGDPDPKLCIELGAAILYDKPILVLVPEDANIPANLTRCASAIIQGNLKDPKTAKRMQEAIDKILANDLRTRPVSLGFAVKTDPAH